MNKEDYLFLQYIHKHYDNIYVRKLIEKYGKGLPLLEKRKIINKVEELDKIDNPKEILFLYIIFKRTKENNYVDELTKQLRNDLGHITKKELSIIYKQLKNLLEEMGIRQPVVTKKVIENIYKFS